MHTITIKVEKEEVYQNLLKILAKFSASEIEFSGLVSNSESQVELEEKISQGLDDVSKGRVRNLNDVLAEAKSKYGL